MRTYAHHHLDTPHGASHPPIPLSVLLTGLFIGAQGVAYVFLRVASPVGSEFFAVYRTGAPFGAVSTAITVLLFGYLLVDLHRHRLEAHGRKAFEWAIFAAGFLLLAAFGLFLFRTG